MKKHTRLLALLLGLVMIFQTLPLSGLADGENNDGNEPATDVVTLPVALAAAPQDGTVYVLGGDNTEGWVQNAQLLVETTESKGEVVDITNRTDVEIPEYAKFQIKIPFKAPSQNNTAGFEGLKPGDTIVYNLPDWVRELDVESGNLKAGNVEAGSWKVENNQVVITLDEDFVTKNQWGLEGTIELSGAMEATKTTVDEEVTSIDFLGKTINTVVRERTDAILNIDIQKIKTGQSHGATGENSGEISSASYELTVFAGSLNSEAQRNNGDLTDIVIDDFFTTKEKYAFVNEAGFFANEDLKQYITYDHIVAVIKDQHGNIVTDRKVVTLDSNKTDAAIQFVIQNNDDSPAVLHPDESIVITYDAIIDKEMYQHNPRGPMTSKTDDYDHFASGGKSGGSNINSVQREGTDGGQTRSWVDRQAENKATVSTASLTEPKTAITKNVQGETEGPLTFLKTWLWKNGSPKSNYKSEYEISLNENPVMNIKGWTFQDDVKGNGQVIISDVRIVRNGSDEIIISLSDLQKEGGITTGNAAGSSTDKIVYTFSESGQYRIFYTAQFTNPTTADEVRCYNGATLTEAGDDGDTYGVFETHTVKGATVTKRLDKTDVINGTIRWQTTIDEGIDVQNGSVYKDFIGWIRKPGNNQPNVESTLADYDKAYDHTIDLSKMDLQITYGEDETPMPASDYTVTVLTKEEIETSGTNSANDTGVSGWHVVYGFKIVFNAAHPGPVLIHYNTVADFANVVNEEEFTNKFTYQANPDPATGYFNGTAFTSYAQKGTLNKVAEKITDENPVIKWHLTINEAKYEAAELKVVDKIPEGLEFDLLRDLQIRWVENGAGASSSTLENWREAYTGNANARNDQWPTDTAVNAKNDYFEASYNENTRELAIVLKDISHKKIEFNVYTQPQISELSNGETHTYENTAKLYTNSSTQTNQLLQSASAKASVSYNFAGKDVVYNEESAPNAEYVIEVNPAGIDINPSGDRYLVEDAAPDGSTLLFLVPGTLEVRDQYGNKLTLNETPGTELSENEVRLTDIGDHSFTLDVPDNKKLTIKYKAFVPGVLGETADLSNSVTLTAENVSINHTLVKNNVPIQKSKVSVDQSNRVYVRKGSSGVDAVLLDGAEFDIYDVTDSDHVTKIGQLITGEKKDDGSYKVGFGLAGTYEASITLENFHIYKIVETKAPLGFETPAGDAAEVGTFVFVTQTPRDNLTQEQYVAEIKAYREAGIQVINQNYTDFTFYKPNYPLGTLKVTKNVLLNGVADGTANDTFYAALFDGEKIFGEAQAIDVKNGTGTTTFVGLEYGKTYILRETDKDGNPVESGLTWDVTYRETTSDENGENAADYEMVRGGLPVMATRDVKPDLTAEINNNRIIGSLALNKHVFIGNDPYTDKEPADSETKFKVTIRTTDNQGTTWYVSDTSGILVNASTLGEDEAIPTLEVSVIHSLKIDNLPMGTYVVEEVLGENNANVAIGRLNFVEATSTITVSPELKNGGETVEETLVNRYTRGSFCIMVTKAWDDENDYDGIRPESVTVQLYRGIMKNGEKVMDTTPQTITYKMAGSGESVTGTDITLNKANNWTFEATGFPKYDDNGVPYVYEWREKEVPAGYDEPKVEAIQISPKEGDITYLYRITNTHKPEKISTTITKEWNDNQNQDGIRPDHVYVTLMAGDEAQGDYRLSEANGWTVTVVNLPKNKKVTEETAEGEKTVLQEIKYTWKETDEIAGYEGKIDPATDEATGETIANSYILTNTHTPATTKVSVRKIWDDANDQDGKRKDVEATVQLTKTVDGKKTNVESAVSVGLTDNWTNSWENLPVYEEGKLITYGVEETLTKNPDNYVNQGAAPAALTAQAEDSGTIVITNSYMPETTETSVVKEWNDDNNHDGMQPATVNVTLYKTVDGKKTKIDEYILSAGNNWTVSRTGLAQYEDQGKQITYSWEETSVPAGYTASYDQQGTKTTITNTHENQKTQATVKKIWEDNKDELKLRPDELKVTLYADNVATDKTATLDADHDWSYTETDLDKYNATGDEISYSWMEELPAINEGGYYLKSIETTKDTAGTTTTLTNAWANTEQVTRTVIKAWDDDGNSAGFRPESVTVKLYQIEGQTRTLAGNEAGYVLNAGNYWTATTEPLPKYDDKGREIVYTFEENAVRGYTLSSTAALAGTTVIVLTNSYTPATTETTVTKNWDDNQNQDGIRPNHIDLKLYKQVGADGAKIQIQTVRLTGGETDESWSTTISDLPLYEGGKIVTYSWEEYESAEGYTSTQNGNTITNIHIPATTQVTVRKIWDDQGDQDGLRKNVKAQAQLWKTVDGQTGAVEAAVDIGTEDGWSQTWTELPVFEGGQRITYSVTEIVEKANEYTAKDPSPASLSATSRDSGVITLTNSYIPKTQNTKVIKKWEDAENHDGKRPETLTVTLVKHIEGKEDEKTDYILSAGNNWSHELTGLAKYEAGKEVTYTWTELKENIPAGYEKTSEETVDGTTTIVNEHAKETTSATVTKVWLDQDNEPMEDPGSATVKVTLYADNQATDIIVTLPTKEGAWTYTAEDLAKYNAKGDLISYSWLEDTSRLGEFILTSVETVRTEDGAATTTLTNKYNPDYITLTAVKAWEDNGNQEGKRPKELKVTLYRGENENDETKEKVGEYTLKAEDGWALTTEPLLKNDNGEEIHYFFAEEEIPEGYALTSEKVSGYTTIFTNSCRKGSLQIEKIFAGIPEDAETDALRFTITGPEGFEPLTVTYGEFNQKTSHLISGLPMGEYTVTEENAEGLIAGYVLSADSVTTGKATVTGGNTAAVRLANIYSKQIPAAKGEYTATKTWINAEAGDNLTASLTLIGYTRTEDGTLAEAGRYTKTLTGNGSVKWEDIPQFTEDGRVIIYTLQEDGVGQDGKVNGFISTVMGDEKNGFTVINRKPEVKVETVAKEIEKEVVKEVVKEVEKEVEKEVIREVEKEVPVEVVKTVPTQTIVYVTPEPEPETVTVSVMKVWDDAGNEDGLRPRSVTVALEANGEAVQQITLNAGNDWSAEVSGLAAQDEAGNPIYYGWTETPVRGYTASYRTMGSTTVITNRHRNATPTPEPTETPAPETGIPTTSVVVRHIWDDNGNEAGMRPGSITVKLSNGQTVVLTEANGWTVTVDNLPATTPDGEPITYTWKEEEVLGYTPTSVITDGNVTTFINEYRRAVAPDGRPVPGNRYLIIEDYGTPLGVEVMINHVGDCFE